MDHKYKVCVYAICKNEEQFVDRWMDYVSEADIVIVTDTGSSDNTIEKLRKRGALVYSYEINPFRFDYSRNYCLTFIPDDVDICVSSDLDDVIEHGWREKLENAWQTDTTRGLYIYNSSFNDDGSPSTQYIHERIHKRQNYHWIYPTHEVLKYTGPEQEKSVFIDGLICSHFPDRSKDRSLNLPLLELAVKEYPQDARNYHYLGRQYMYEGEWNKCIETLKKYLEISVWDEERSVSMRYIAKSYGKLENKLEQKKWLYRAMAETPGLREPYIELAYISYNEKNWPALYFYCTEALKIKVKTNRYTNEPYSWNHTPYDFAAIACYNLKLFNEAVVYSLEALKLYPDNERLKNNHHFYTEALK